VSAVFAGARLDGLRRLASGEEPTFNGAPLSMGSPSMLARGLVGLAGTEVLNEVNVATGASEG
jgi:hypothetical protein